MAALDAGVVLGLMFVIDRVSRRAVLSLPAHGHGGTLGAVPPGATVSGVITMPGAGGGKVVRLRVIERDGREPFELGLEIDD